MISLKLRALILALFITPVLAMAQNDLVLNALPKQKKIADKLFSLLQKEHYRKLTVDDNLSQEIFNRYLDFLDPSKTLFLQSDVKELKKHQFHLDDSLRKGDLGPAFEIFNRFAERLIERLEFFNQAAAEKMDELDFTTSETLLLERDEAPWIESKEAAYELWFKMFKNDVLNLRLAGRTMEELKEILTRRYADRLRRAKQTKSSDVFRVFMTAYAGSYDPHTEYFPPRDAENFDISMKLSYEGIGALLTSDGEYTSVNRLIAAGPAEKSGLLNPGDRIVGVSQGEDGETAHVVGWRLDEVVELIRGEKGTMVRLDIIPANQPDTGSTRTIKLMRDEVKLEEQAAKKKIVEVKRQDKTYRIGVIELPTFYVDFEGMRNGDANYKSGTRDVQKILEELKGEKVDGVVVDLRDNGGGSLMEARDLTALFAGPGPIVQIRGYNGRIQVLGTEEIPVYSGPLAVLVNRLSASASEIFAAAIQDLGRGVVLGGRTFGKGTVQTLVNVDDGQLKLTRAKFYRISGGSTQHKGVFPDILFPPLYDIKEIGESSYEGALPWDEIDEFKFKTDQSIQDKLPQLLAQHNQRIKKNPEFAYMLDQLSYMNEIKKRKSVSLNEEIRKAEREENEARLLAILNKKRANEGKEPLKSFDDLEDETKKEEADVFAKEAAQILVDAAYKE